MYDDDDNDDAVDHALVRLLALAAGGTVTTTLFGELLMQWRTAAVVLAPPGDSPTMCSLYGHRPGELFGRRAFVAHRDALAWLIAAAHRLHSLQRASGVAVARRHVSHAAAELALWTYPWGSLPSTPSDWRLLRHIGVRRARLPRGSGDQADALMTRLPFTRLAEGPGGIEPVVLADETLMAPGPAGGSTPQLAIRHAAGILSAAARTRRVDAAAVADEIKALRALLETEDGDAAAYTFVIDLLGPDLGRFVTAAKRPTAALLDTVTTTAALLRITRDATTGLDLGTDLVAHLEPGDLIDAPDGTRILDLPAGRLKFAMVGPTAVGWAIWLRGRLVQTAMFALDPRRLAEVTSAMSRLPDAEAALALDTALHLPWLNER